MRLEYDKKERVLRSKSSPQDIYDFYLSRDYFFLDETITRYFLSIKTKPFVILTGISGTGKTKIAQIFADYICQGMSPEVKAGHIAFIPVRPDWMDNKGLIGYYNLLEEKYQDTPLLRLMMEARRNPGQPYFVILDEMNLAKVEQYFSDFLSIMESRTIDRPDGESILLHNMDEAASADGQEIPRDVKIPNNLFFTGTVNVDESTYMFSPKVLDRANVIEFNEVDFAGYQSGASRNNSNFRLHPEDVRKRLIDSDLSPFCSINDYHSILDGHREHIESLRNLHEVLEKYNMHFGYRVINEISRFLLLAKEHVGDGSLDTALDIQFIQKVMPKFHGTQGRLEPVLEDILAFCYGQDGEPSEDLIYRAAGFDSEAGFPRTAQKTARMLRQVRQQGYTSYIE